ncbi:MAG: hypothetical protein ACTHM6_01460 [Tepidisphaeraceae bacterium]
MKNATKHADNLKSLLKKLLKEGKPEPKQPVDPLRALVMGILSYDTTDARAQGAMAIIDREFVDLNELRVATELEVVEIIGPKYPEIEHRVVMFREILNMIFEKEHTLSFERLKTLGKKDGRAFLKELPEMTPFVEAYTMLFGMDAAAAPIDETIREQLLEADAIEPESTVEDAQKFVESHLKADEIYELFVTTRRAAAAKKSK